MVSRNVLEPVHFLLGRVRVCHHCHCRLAAGGAPQHAPRGGRGLCSLLAGCSASLGHLFLYMETGAWE